MSSNGKAVADKIAKRKRPAVPALRLWTLDDDRAALSAADAQGSKSDVQVAFCHFIKERDEDAVAGCADRVTQCDSAAVDVGLGHEGFAVHAGRAERNAARVNAIVFYCPEGQLGSYSPAEWISMAELYGDPSEELTAYEVAGVGTIYMPEGGEVYGEEQAEPLPNVQAGINLGDTNIHFGAFTAASYMCYSTGL